jgi:Fe-S-cluster containining protein
MHLKTHYAILDPPRYNIKMRGEKELPAKVEIVVRKIKGKTGYDVAVRDPAASVEDYLTALDHAIMKAPLYRARTSGRTSCYGCDRCCAERLPLTWIDYLNLRAAVHPKADPEAFLAAYGHVLVDGPVADITLAAAADGRCCFLDPDRRACRVYPARPLTCRTFVCSPSTGRARRLRSILVNRGEDELVRQWLLAARRRGGPPIIHEGYRPRPQLENWPPTPFAGRASYLEIPLKTICSPGLWRDLTKGEFLRE